MKILDASSSETMFHLESKSGENIKSKFVCKEETEKKIKKVVKAKWNGSYSVMVVDGKTYKINDKQRTSLDKIMPKVKVIIVKSIQVMVCWHIFLIFSFLAKMLSSLSRNHNIFARNENI